jgi:hypothetical protein
MSKPTAEQEIKLREIFSDFHHKKITDEQLIKRLRTVENKTRSGHKTIWFRFFGNDTAATTVNNIERALNTLPNCYQNNRKYMQENIEMAVNENSLKINFS